MDFLVNSRVETEVIMGDGILCDRERRPRRKECKSCSLDLACLLYVHGRV